MPAVIIQFLPCSRRGGDGERPGELLDQSGLDGHPRQYLLHGI